jgi:hypothetical protein
MRLSRLVLVLAQRLNLSDPGILKKRIDNLFREPDKANVADFLVELAAEDPGRKALAEELLQKLNEGKLDGKQALTEIYDTFKKWKQIAKKQLPGVQKKAIAEMKRAMNRSGDPWLKKNRVKIANEASKLMADMIISLNQTVFVYNEFESAMFWTIHGETRKVHGRIHFRQDNSRYRNWRYYTDSYDSEPLGTGEKQKILHLRQPYSRKEEDHKLKTAGVTSVRGLSRQEFAALKKDIKKLKVPMTLRYWTSPKHATGQITVKPTKRNDYMFTEAQVVKVLKYLIANGYFAPQVSLQEMLRNPIIWRGGGISFYTLAE